MVRRFQSSRRKNHRSTDSHAEWKVPKSAAIVLMSNPDKTYKRIPPPLARGPSFEAWEDPCEMELLHASHARSGPDTPSMDSAHLDVRSIQEAAEHRR